LDEKISQLEDRQKAIDDLTAKVALHKSKVTDRNKKKQALENDEKLLVNRIDRHSATVLGTLNKQFA